MSQEFLTENPLLTAAAGEEVTQADQKINYDFNTLSAPSFIGKYGEEAYLSMMQQSEAIDEAARSAQAAGSRGNDQLIADSVKNILSSAVTGGIDTAAFIADFAGPRSLSKALAETSDSIRKSAQEAGSIAERAQRDLYGFQQQALKHRLDREYKEDIASGKSVTEATAERFLKEYLGSGKNAFESGQVTEMATSGLGSILTGGVVSKGIGLGAKAARTVMPKVASGVDAFAKSNKVAEKIVKNSPWMASMGAQEGGGAYSQQLLEGLGMSVEDLRAHSPQFNAAVKHYVEQGYSLPEAEQKAKEDMAFAAARQASLETAAAAFAANYLTAPLAKMTKGDKMLSRYIGEALGEPVEESITEGLGQIAGNKATRDYLDQRQELMEDVGQSAAEGAVGGLGIVGARAAAQTPALATNAALLAKDGLGLVGKGIGATYNAYKEHKQEVAISPENTYKNIDKALNTDFSNTKLSEEDINSLNTINSTLKERADKVFDTSNQSLDDLLDIYRNTINDIVSVSNASGKLDITNKRKANATYEALQAIQMNAMRSIEERIKANRDTYTEGTPLTQEQLDAEGVYLSANAMYNTEAFAKAIESLSDTQVQQLREANFTNPKVAIGMKNAFNLYDDYLNNKEDGASNPQDINPEDTTNPSDSSEDTSEPVDPIDPPEDPIEPVEPPQDTNPPQDQQQKAPTTSPITGRGKHHWDDPNVNEVYVGGEGFKYPKGKLTRPGTAPTQWNGQEISSIKDDRGNQAIGKFYSANGSEYVFTKEGTVRRIKFDDPDTDGKDQGVQNWKDTYFLDPEDPLYKDLFSGLGFAKHRSKFKNLRVDPNTRKVVFDDLNTGKTRPLMFSDVVPNAFTPEALARNKGKYQDHDFTFPESRGEPKVGKTLVEFRFGENGEIISSHASGGIAYIENQQPPSPPSPPPSEPPKPKKDPKGFNTDLFDDGEDLKDAYEEPKKESRQTVDYASISDFKEISLSSFDDSSLIRFKDATLGIRFNDKVYLLTKDEIEKFNRDFQEIAKNYSIPPESLGLFTTKLFEVLGEKKAKEIYEEINSRSFVDFESDPVELEKKKLYLEDGVYKDLAHDELNENLKNTFGDKVASMFIVAARPFHVWNNTKKPIDAFRSLFLSKDNLTEYLRKNRFTNAESLVRKVFFNSNNLETAVNPDITTVNNYQSLANQLYAITSKDGHFVKDLRRGLKEQIQASLSSLPDSVKEFLLDKDGEINNRTFEVLVLASAHWLSTLSNGQHEMTEDELEAINIDLNIQSHDFDTLGGILEPVALRHLSTAVRKVMGITPKSSASIPEVENFFGALSTTVAGAMLKAGHITSTPFEYTIEDPISKQRSTGAYQKLAPSDYYTRVFKSKADIIVALLDPKMKNTLNEAPPEVKKIVNGTGCPVTKAVANTIQRANNTPFKVNKWLLKLITAIGGEAAIGTVLGDSARPEDRLRYSVADFVANKGRNMTRGIALDVLREFLIGNNNQDLDSSELYFSWVALKNSRINMEGSAVPQTDKLLRVLMQPVMGNLDLTKDHMKQVWKIVLAQNLGKKVGKVEYDTYKDDIEGFLDKINKIVKDPSSPYQDLITNISNTDPYEFLDDNKATASNNNTQLLQDLLAEIDAECNVDIYSYEGINAVLEAIRVATATQKELADFDSKVLLETDGITDGPSYINMLFAMALGANGADFVRIAAKTGFLLGVDTTAQKVIGGVKTEEAELFESRGRDMHSDVSEIKATEFTLLRLGTINNELKTAQGDAKKQLHIIKKTICAALTFLQATHFINGDVSKAFDITLEEAEAIAKTPDKFKEQFFVFDLLLSKKSTTVVDYGSQERGLIEQLLNLGIKNFYKDITDSISYILNGTTAPQVKEIQTFQDTIQNNEVFVIDTETTNMGTDGPDISKDDIVQISVRCLNKGKHDPSKDKVWWIKKDPNKSFKESFKDGTANPMYKAYPEAEKQGLTQDKDTVYLELQKHIGSGILVGHNIQGFDIKMLEKHSMGQITKLTNPILDTLTLARRIYPRNKVNTLQELAKNFNLTAKDPNVPATSSLAHLADADTYTTIQLINQMLKDADKAKDQYKTAKFDLKRDPNEFNNVPLSTTLEALRTLFASEFNGDNKDNPFSSLLFDVAGSPEDIFKVKANIDAKMGEFVVSPVNRLPNKEELSKPLTSFNRGRPYLYTEAPEGTVDKNGKKMDKVIANDLRNFDIKPKGMEHLINIITPLLGAPIRLGTVEATGNTGLDAIFQLASCIGLINATSMMEEQSAIGTEGEKLYQPGANNGKDFTFADLHKMRMKQVRKNTIHHKGGASIVVRKTRMTRKGKPVFKDTSTKLGYYPSTEMLDVAGLSAGALGIQGAGDATTMAKTYEEVEIIQELIEFMEMHFLSVHDGHYTNARYSEKLGELTNKAANYSVRQPFLSSVVEHLISVCTDLTKKQYKSIKDPELAFARAIYYVAQGKDLSGNQVLPKDSPQLLEFQKHIFRYFQAFDKTSYFEPSVLKSRNIFISTPGVTKATNTFNELRTSDESNNRVTLGKAFSFNFIKDAVGQMFTALQVNALNERIMKKVMDKIPRTVHHMSGLDVGYKVGQPLSIAEAKALLDEVNKDYIGAGKYTWNELIAAYMMYLADEIVEKEFKNDPVFKKYKEAWIKQTGRNIYNNKLILTPARDAKAIGLLNKAFNNFQEKPFVPATLYTKTRLARSEIKQLIRNAFIHTGEPHLFTSLYQKLSGSLPQDLEVHFAESVDDFPRALRQKWKSKKISNRQRGLMCVHNGHPVVMVLASKDTKRLEDPENVQVLLHELIHSVLSTKFITYFEDKAKGLSPKNQRLSEEEVNAIENLEELIGNLLKHFKAGDPTLCTDPVLAEFLTYIQNIKNPAEQLDEATAYILANSGYYQRLLNFVPSNRNRIKRKTYKLIKILTSQVTNLFRKLLNIVTGSTLEKELTWDKAKKDITKPHVLADFVSLYGTNSVILFDSIINSPKGFNRKDNYINSDITRAQIYSPKFSGHIADNLDDAIALSARNMAIFEETTKKNFGGLKEEISSKVQEEKTKYLNYVKEAKDTFNSLGLSINNVKSLTSLLLPLSLNPDDKSLMSSLRNMIVSQITPTTFVKDTKKATKEDLAKSKAIYDLMKGNITPTSLLRKDKPSAFDPKFELNAVFYALVESEPLVASQLKTININIKDPGYPGFKDSIFSPSEAFGKIGDKLAADRMKLKIGTGSPIKVLDAARKTTTEILNDKNNLSLFSQFNNVLDKGFKKGDELLINFINSLISLFNKNSKSLELHRLYKDPLHTYAMTTESIRSFMNRNVSPQWASFTKESYGRTASNTEEESFLKVIKGWFDKIREQNLNALPEKLKKAWKKQPTKKISNFLHRTFAQLDFTCLDFDTIKRLAKDPKVLDQEIQKIEDAILQEAPKDYQLYFSKAKEWADWKTKNAQASPNLLRNAVAIARKLGIRPDLSISENSDLVKNIDKLMTLYAFKNLSSGDKAEFYSLVETETQAIKEIYNHIKDTKEFEYQRASETEKAHLHNVNKGYLPSGDLVTGKFIFVPKKHIKRMESQGYKYLSDYAASNIDPSEDYICMYCKYPQDKAMQEGMLQTINQTYYGYQYESGTSGEAIGSRIKNKRNAEHIAKYASSEAKGNCLLPLYNKHGNIIGYERSIPPEHRHFFEEGLDIFSGIAKWKEHQIREDLAKILNPKAAELAKKQWELASKKERQEEFVDLFAMKDPVIKDAMSKLSPSVIKVMKDTFGGNHFYVKKDMVWSYIGYERASLTDMWDGKFFFPPNVEKAIAKILDLLVPNGKARYYVGNLEKMLMGLVTFSRDTIVIRSGIVPLVNAIANILVLHLALGIPFPTIYQLYKKNLVDTQTFNRIQKELGQLEYDLVNAKTEKEKNKLLEKKEYLINERDNLPIYRLLKEGEYSTISPEGTIYDEIEITKQNFDDVLNSVTERMPKFGYVRQATSEVLMLKGSSSYKFLTDFTNMGDWIAKATAYRYLTEIAPNKHSFMTHEVARNIASILFVDFDQFTGRERDWTNRIGLTWFMTYKYRMIPAALLSMLMNPSRILLGSAFTSATGFAGTPVTENMFSHILSLNIFNSTGLDMIFRGLSLHPLAVFTGLGK